MKPNKYAKYFAIEKRLRAQGYDGTRAGLILEFTNDRKSGLTQLSDNEYQVFLMWLNDTYPANLSMPDSKENIMRRKMIALFRKIGYNDGNFADMERITAWVLKYGYLHKRLNDYSLNELPALVTQVEQYYKSTLE